MKIYTKISIGLIAGVIFGLVLGPKAAIVEPIGKAFIRLITMVVVPLVFASLAVGTASLGSINRLGRIGFKTISFYLLTTAIAVTIGLLLANIIQPGAGLNETVKTSLLQNYQETSREQLNKAMANKPRLVDLLLQIIPTNPLRAMADGDMLGLIFFSLALGIALTYLPTARSQPVISFLEGLNEAIIQLVHLIMKVAPYGVFALIAAVTGRFGYTILITLIKYALVVLLGLMIHISGTYSVLLRVLGKMNPWRFFKGLRDAQLVAFSTSSSNAALPVNMKCCQENLGVPKEITSFVLPLGATINMDGTALYQGVAAVFIAQVYGLSLTALDQLIVVLTATLASIGAAGVPSAGIVTLTLVLQTIGIPLEGIALILGVDRILDMCRTVVNMTGDATCAVFIARTEKKRQSKIEARLSMAPDNVS
ncbi:MAG: dicarboxylate/amino acid:cation symporter [candidate division KSB1 bacterium]|nr:dicarboxylate/amino acid:cation symporter [candidate division KSB1 bacterium]MDZ7341650.1 dicarboxylate/amino acid:cation symporter [candidate division KSB1 bacterium]